MRVPPMTQEQAWSVRHAKRLRRVSKQILRGDAKVVEGKLVRPAQPKHEKLMLPQEKRRHSKVGALLWRSRRGRA